MTCKYDSFYEKLQSLKSSNLLNKTQRENNSPENIKSFSHLENRILINENLFQKQNELFELKINILENSLEKLTGILEDDIKFETESSNNFLQQIKETKDFYTEKIIESNDITQNLKETNQNYFSIFNNKYEEENKETDGIKKIIDNSNNDVVKDITVILEKLNENEKNQNNSLLEIKNSVNDEIENIRDFLKNEGNQIDENYDKYKKMIKDIIVQTKSMQMEEKYKRNNFKENIDKISENTLVQLYENNKEVEDNENWQSPMK